MSVYYIAGYPVSDELYHHGIRGQRWGVRRYQNPDGSLTSAGRARYGSVENFKNYKDYKSALNSYHKNKSDSNSKKLDEAFKKYDESRFNESAKRGNRMRREGFSEKSVINSGVYRQVSISTTTQLALIAAGAGIAQALRNYHVNINDPETAATIMRGTRAVGNIIRSAAAVATVANIAKTAKDYNDIKNSREKSVKK